MIRIFTSVVCRSAMMALLVGIVQLSGCGGGALQPGAVDQHVEELMAKDANFLLIRSRPGDSFRSIAERLYGSATAAQRLRELNPALDPQGGELVAAPARVVNPSGVYRTGYRTIPILSYHQFTARQQARNRLQQTASGFRAQLTFIRDQGYQVLRLSQLPEYLNGAREIPPKSVIITIDDGYRSAYDVAYPLLREFGYPVTLFVYTDFIGAPAAVSWPQMKTMLASGLVDIQSHAKSHASLVAPSVPTADYSRWLVAEVTEGRRILEQRLGYRVDLFSYPYGDSNDAAVMLLKKQGFRLATTVHQGGNPSFSDPYRLRRTMVYSDDDLSSFKRKLQVFVPVRNW
ncbi:MAG: polysaccharide deacetylase family protein [Motiliproteus sp.]